MRITPQSLEIEGFRSFTEKQIFQFPTQPGLGLITGENQIEDIASEGAGKSSTWSALFWVLFGKSERGLASPSLHNWKGKNPLYVKFNFLVDGKPGSYIERTWKPIIKIILCIDGVARQVSQSDLEAWLGRTPLVFLQGGFGGQFTTLFLDLDAPTKQTFLMNLLNMERWTRYQDAADQRVTQIANEKSKIELDIAKLEHHLQTINAEYETYTAKARTWEADKQTRITAVETKIQTYQTQLDALIQSANSIETGVFEDVALLQESLTKYQQSMVDIQSKVDSLNLSLGEVQALKKSSEAADQKLKKFAVAGYICPTCNQPTDAEHIKKEHQQHVSDIKGFSDQIDSISQDKAKLLTTLTNHKTKCTSLTSRIREVENQKQVYERQVQGLKTQQTTIQVQINSLNEQIETIRAETNAYEAIVREKLDGIRITQSQLETFKSQVKSLSAHEGIYEFWKKKGFKEIQLFLLGEVTTQLEMAYNSSLSALNLGDWKLQVTLENETKSGAIQNKFVINVLPPGKTEAVPLESWCGGETQRLRLAAAFGTIDLVNQVSQVIWDLEIWDEPGQHMTAAGLHDLFSILRQRAKVLGKQIFVTDHRTLQDEQFDFHHHIIKTPTGSIIQN